MSTNNISNSQDKILNEDSSVLSSSTTVSVTDSITQDISKVKNTYLIPKNIIQRISEILSYIQSDSNSANNKIPILKYLQSLFLSVEFNSEIFLRKSINDKEKLNLYKVIINQYIFYTNSVNTKLDEEIYRGDLQNLFLLLLSQVTLDKETYHYILSPLINFINEKNTLNTNKKNLSGTNVIETESNNNLKPEHLKRLITLLKYFYGYYKSEQSFNEIQNYLFFSGDNDSSIIIKNKDNPSEPSKKLLNLDETLCIMVFIKVLPSEYIKQIYQKSTFKLLELNFQDKKQPIQINVNIDNHIIIPPYDSKMKLKENATNCVLIKINYNKKKPSINFQIYIGQDKLDFPPIPLNDVEKEKNNKIKEEIKDITLFKNFLGICSNIIIYKEKKNEGLPKFLSPYYENNKQRMSIKGDVNNVNNKSNMRLLFPNGIYNEELYLYFAKAELIEQQENSLQNFVINDEQPINYNILKDFITNNLIAIYIPTRYVIPEEKSIQNTSQITLIDSINGLNAEFTTRNPTSNGLHIFQNLYEKDLSIIGGVNNLLPIMELMLDNNEFLNIENFFEFFELITVYIFCPKYQIALSNDKSHFFKILSYFLEKIPEKYFNENLVENFRTILVFLCPPSSEDNNNNNHSQSKYQFFNYILTNEKILLKFNEDNQKVLINLIASTVEKSDLEADIIKIIRIMLNFDRNRNYKFCCRYHSQFFNDNYSIMDPKLSDRLQPIEKLLEIVFEKKYQSTMKKYKENSDNNIQNKNAKKPSSKTIQKYGDQNTFEDNNLYYLFYLLTYNISPCLQKSILKLIQNLMNQYKYETFSKIFDKKKELFEIILFVFKTSIFEIKIKALNLLLHIDKQNNWINLKRSNIIMLIHKEIIPVFLLDEANTLHNTKEKLEKNINEEIKKDINININEEKDNVEEMNNINIEGKNEIINEEKKLNENNYILNLKPKIEINKIRFSLFSPTEMEQKIYSKYSKKQFKQFLKELYDNIINFFYDSDIIFNLIVRIVSNGDLFLINDFISKIRAITDSVDFQKNKLYNAIVNNNYFLQFILDSYLQLYILNNNKDKEKKFIPSFSIDLFKTPKILEEKEIPYTDSEKKEILMKALNTCEKILLFIITENITNFDYVLTWGKYYERLKEENDIYNYTFEIIDKIIFSIISGQNKAVATLSGKINLNELKTQSTLYFFNISLEYITFFQLNYNNNSFFHMDKEDRYKTLEEDLKYILYEGKNQEIKSLTPIQELEISNENKMKNFLVLTVILSSLQPLWLGEEKNPLANEKGLYTKLTIGSVNKNLFANELEFLLYIFDEKFFINMKNICNGGIKMIILLYLFLTCILNIGGEKSQIIDYFGHLRMFLSVLIVSPPSLNISEAIKKKKWPNDVQYEEVNSTVYYIISNSIYFLYNKLQILKNQEKVYNSQSETEKENDKKTKENIDILKKIYMENLGYILKILNNIYRGAKEVENQNKSWNFFNAKKKIFDRIKKTGAFKFINELYNECFIQNIEKTNSDLSKKKNQDVKNPNIFSNTNEYKTGVYNKDSNKSLDIKISHSDDFHEISNNTEQENDNEIMPKLSSCKTVINKDIKKELEIVKENNNLNINFAEENYLDDIAKINFFKANTKNFNLTDEEVKNLEKNINLFLEDEKVKNYYQKHFYKNIAKLYTFLPIIQKRQEKIEKMIPIFDNRKNLTHYPNDLCLVPYYYAENFYKEELFNKIGNMNKNLREEIRLNARILERDEMEREVYYRNHKKKMFKFKGIWSYEDFFYDNKKYKLKYKLLNHYTNDFTKIFMTPITDIDYYLPKFSKFEGNIFRNELSEPSLIPVTKFVEICFPKNKEKKEINNNNSENQKKTNISENNNTNNSMISFESSNYTSFISNLNDTKENANMSLNPVYELNQEYYSFLKEQEMKESEILSNNFNPKDFEIFTKFITKKHLKEKGSGLQCEACLVKLPFHIRGIIYINNKEIGFYSYEIKRTEEDEDYDFDKKACFGSIFREQSEKYKNYYKKIPFKYIEFILKRRYYFKRNVLEIFTQDKKSFFFRIDEKKFEEFFNAIISNFKNYLELDDINIEGSKAEKKIGLINKSNLLYDYNNYQLLFPGGKSSTTKNLYSKWTKWEISTFTLLNYINLLASRSYHDINQYPVFPWIITDYKSKEVPDLSLDNNHGPNDCCDYDIKIRPFGCPMGMLEISENSRERAENYLINFDCNDDKMQDELSDRYGSHYSTGLHLTYYLLRVFPFSYIRIEMQGKNFDDPNRIFNSVEVSFENATSQKSDLRELIPEFFCFPEMFFNMNDLNLGEIDDEKTKKKIPLNDITMPPWSNNNAYTFVKYHREMLESIEVSEKIHDWFNIIFGIKQKGNLAKKIHNLFFAQTYDDFDEKHKTSPAAEKVYQKKMVEFGVTPSQVFKNDLEKRMLIKNLRKKPIMYEFMAKKEKKSEKGENLFTWEHEHEIQVRESELYIEGSPYKMFSSYKIDEEHKHEKMLYLYSDKVRIISRTEKGFFKRQKITKMPSIKEVNKIKENKDIKEIKENLKPEDKENQENDSKENSISIKEESEENKEVQNKSLKEKDIKNSNERSIEEDSEIKDEEINDIASNKGVSKYDRILICPKYRMDINQSPTIIYDKGNYIALGGFWNGQIIINRLEEIEKSKKSKNSKNINIISTKYLYPITNMKMDESESFVICSNKIGSIFIFAVYKENKIEWILCKTIQDTQKEITSMDLNENLNIFITCDKEGFINLYTFPKSKLFNSYKLNENQLLTNNNLNENNSFSISNSGSNINLSLNPMDIYADLIIISHNPLPCFVLYIKLKKCLCVFSINFHFINAKYGIELVPNGIKKYSDYFRRDYLFIYNKITKTIDIYDIYNLQIISRSSKFGYSFVDFYFSKGMEWALIMVKIEDEEYKNGNIKEQISKKNYKILMLNSQLKMDGKAA